MAVEPGDAEFTSKLNEASKEKAKEELNEPNDADRILAVQTLRKWILEQDYLRTPTDINFLLRFLRTRKFSQLGARELIENYWTSRTATPEWFKDVDPRDPNILEILKSGFKLSPKVYDSEGRRIVLDRPGRLNTDIVENVGGIDNVLRAMGLFHDWLTLDENVQVNGVCVFGDFSDAQLSIQNSIWTAENGKKLFGFYQDSAIRIKQMHFYNEPSSYDDVFTLIKPCMNDKLNARTIRHGSSMVNAYKEVDCILPDEYLPSNYTGPSAGPVRKIIEDMIEEMTQPGFRSYIQRLSSGEYGIYLNKKKP